MKKGIVHLFFLVILFFISCSDSNKTDKISGEKTCPEGHDDNIIPIQYGMPDKSSMEASERGEVYLGGCEITDDSPKWFCKDHEITF